ncbi:MAG: S8 family peptidase [Saprospiraceae bacterium]|nr:S8 family peptidase [Saprospiraceae bacterium]
MRHYWLYILLLFGPVLPLTAQVEENTDFLVVLSQLDLSHMDLMHGKVKKGREVYSKLKSHAQVTQARLIKLLERKGVDYRSYCVANVISISASSATIDELAALEEVRKIIPDYRFQVPDDQLEKIQSPAARNIEMVPWGLELIGADKVWELGFRGQNVVVGGHDTGVEWTHPALIQNYRGWNEGLVQHSYNWHDAIHAISPLHQDSIITDSTNPCGLSISSPCDDAASSHGTHTLGTIIGFDPVTDYAVGVAPEAKWIAVRNMERGYGSISSYLEGFEWFLAPTDSTGSNPDPDQAPHVINNSWACIEEEGCNPANFEILQTAVENLRKAGIVVVASAGNSGNQGCESISTPAAIYDAALTVGSVDSTDTLSSFSSRGPVSVDGSFRIKPDVVAPGRMVLSAIRDNQYGYLTGTSMAGPHVAGLVALIISANPNLSGDVDAIEQVIFNSAIKKNDPEACQEGDSTPGQNALYGFGRVDAYAAVMEAINFTTAIRESPDRRANFNVFPNPANEYVNVKSNILRKGSLRVYDLTGRIIVTENQFNEETILSTCLWPLGSYIVEIADQSGQPYRQLLQVIH